MILLRLLQLLVQTWNVAAVVAGAITATDVQCCCCGCGSALDFAMHIVFETVEVHDAVAAAVSAPCRRERTVAVAAAMPANAANAHGLTPIQGSSRSPIRWWLLPPPLPAPLLPAVVAASTAQPPLQVVPHLRIRM